MPSRASSLVIASLEGPSRDALLRVDEHEAKLDDAFAAGKKAWPALAAAKTGARTLHHAAAAPRQITQEAVPAQRGDH